MKSIKNNQKELQITNSNTHSFDSKINNIDSYINDNSIIIFNTKANDKLNKEIKRKKMIKKQFKNKQKNDKESILLVNDRNHRKSFAVEQLLALECQYAKSKYLKGQRRYQLAKELILTEKQIKIW